MVLIRQGKGEKQVNANSALRESKEVVIQLQ